MATYFHRPFGIALVMVLGCVTFCPTSVLAAITPPEGDPSTYNPNGVTLEQGLPSGYVEGEEVEISVEIGVPASEAAGILALGFEQELPPGWTYARVGRLISGKFPDLLPSGTTGNELAFAWVSTSAAFPYHFTYYATPAGDQSVPLTLRGQVQYRTMGPAQYSDIATLMLDLMADNMPPVITLIGGDIVVIERGDDYLDPGWSATDDVDGDLTALVEVEGLDTLDPNTIGEYTLIYRVADAAGNNALPRVRTVQVVMADNEPPVITLAGGEIVVIERGDDYVDPGWTATDDVDGDITALVEVEGLDTLDPDTIGEYTLTYRVADAAGNNALPRTRTVKVVKPRLTLKELFGCGPMEREDASGMTDLIVVLASALVLLGSACRTPGSKQAQERMRGR